MIPGMGMFGVVCPCQVLHPFSQNGTVLLRLGVKDVSIVRDIILFCVILSIVARLTLLIMMDELVTWRIGTLFI